MDKFKYSVFPVNFSKKIRNLIWFKKKKKHSVEFFFFLNLIRYPRTLDNFSKIHAISN